MMNDLVKIELAKPEDAEILADISKRAFESDIEVGAPSPGERERREREGYDSVEAQRRDALNGRTDYWKVLYDGQIVGGTRVYKPSLEHCYIYGVFVDPDFHGRGIGTQFFEKIERHYPDAKKWTLDTPEWNVRTKGFYEKVGFVQTGILRWVPSFDLHYYVKITDDSYQAKIVPISDLQEGMKGLVVQGRVVEISEKRDVASSDGKPLQVANAKIADETGSITLVLWNDMIRQVNEGEDVIIENANVSVYNNDLQLGISRQGQVIIT